MPEYVGKGFGYSLVQSVIDFILENKAKKVFVTVSSNNLAIIKVISKYKFRVDDERYVFVRHR